MTPVTPEQTAEILRLVAEGLDNNSIAERVNVMPGQVRAVKAVAARGKGQTDTSSDEVIGDAIETTFGLERDLEAWLRKNIADLENGSVSIIDDGRQRKVPAGFIDITGRDRDGAGRDRIKGWRCGSGGARSNPGLHGRPHADREIGSRHPDSR